MTKGSDMRRLRDLLTLASGWRLAGAVLPFVAATLLLGALGIFCMDVLSSARAFVGGEGLWSKAQKDAILHLQHYAITGAPDEYLQFQRAIAVPLGDHEARLALDQPGVDVDAVRKGFLAGRNHPDDINGMIRLYRNFRNVSFMHDAIAKWAQGDDGIVELVEEASRLHAALSSGHADAALVQSSVKRIAAINERLTPLEDAFSFSLGEASRKTQQLLLLAVICVGALVIVLAGYVSRHLLRKNAANQEQLREMAVQAAEEQVRRESNERIRDQATLLERARDAIIIRGLDDRIVFWNKSAERLYGWTVEEAMGKRVQDLLFSSDLSVFDAAAKAVYETGEWSGDMTKCNKNGALLAVESRWTLLFDDQGHPKSILVIDTDVTERKAAQREMERLAVHDALTDLPNRRLLVDRLQLALVNSVRNRRNGALLFIDLDNFKSLNDTFGHDRGDLLLQQVACRVVDAVRTSDTVARLGGDEFVVLLPELSERVGEAALQAQSVGDKLLAVLAEPYLLSGRRYDTTASIGIAVFCGELETAGDLLKQADLAMYEAKSAGRNTVRFYNPEMHAIVSARMALEADLRDALRGLEFQLFYQAQVAANGTVVGVEALLRWPHKTRGMIPPSDFIPVAESSGLIEPLGNWVLETACRQLARWAQHPRTADLSMAVNVSVRQLRHPDFVEHVVGVIADTGANPLRLKLELTESMLVTDIEATIVKMVALKAKGVSFSLDDFGSGYSSLMYLKRLPFSQLKIDQSFVRDVLIDPNDAAIARTIIALGRSLGLDVIAEGVETDDQLDFLAIHGCRLYQGYLFGRPLPIEQLDIAADETPSIHDS
jgi:diguanylate cyclase (GGDEF)-like protein/PAS domain S-box-containing protein